VYWNSRFLMNQMPSDGRLLEEEEGKEEGSYLLTICW
jgi:hypothetical protein